MGETTCTCGAPLGENWNCKTCCPNQMKLKVKRLTETAKLPTYGSEGAAAFDFYADIEITGSPVARHPLIILTGDAYTSISTGIAVEVPEGYVLKIFSRSGHGFKSNVKLSNCVGIIDSDYRGEIKVSLHNGGFANFSVKHGDRIAQGILEKAKQVEIIEVDKLTETKRGTGGFGSTGK